MGNNKKYLDELHSGLVRIVLEELINVLVITNRGRRQSVPTKIFKEPVVVRFQSKIHDSVYHELDPFRDSQDVLNEAKQQIDINLLICHLEKTVEELKTGFTYEYLTKMVDEYKKEMSDEVGLLRSYIESKALAINLRHKIKDMLKTSQHQLDCAEDILETLRYNLNNCRRVCALESSLVSRWDVARAQQAITLNENEETNLEETIKSFMIKKENEERIVHDIESFNNLQIERYESLINCWRAKRVDDLAELDEKIKDILESTTDVMKKLEQHRKIFSNRQEFIDEYRERKAREQAQYDFQQNRILSAIKIQAWWRGMMVRCHLGPYRKKKKSKKGKKGK